MTQLLLPVESSPETEIKSVGGTDLVYYDGELIVELGRKKALDNVWCHPEKGFKVGRCKMIKRSGGRCRNAVRHGWTVCRNHGAGSPDRPGGRPVTIGRHSQHLPKRFLENYEQYLNDPDYLVMRSEMALLDARMGEILEKLDDAVSDNAWMQVRRALSLLKTKDRLSPDEVMDLTGYLEEALEMTATEAEVWDEVTGLIEARRKVADTERRRITEAQKYLTYDEAHAMMALFVNAVTETVKDESIRTQILERMKVVTR